MSSTFTTTLPTSFIQSADGAKIYFDATGSGSSIVKIKPVSALAANQWYTVTLMLGGAPSAKFYKAPV